MGLAREVRSYAWLLLGCLGVACARGDDRSFAPDGGKSGSSLPVAILDGLSVDENVLSCATDEASGQVRLDPRRLRVHRADLDGDSRAEWLVASTDACITRKAAAVWWVFRGIDEESMGETDGPPLILRTQASGLSVSAERHQGFADLQARGVNTVTYRYDGQAYAVQPAVSAKPASDAGSGALKTLVDLREPFLFNQPRVDSAKHARVAGFARLGADAAINSLLQGHFTEGSAQQNLYVVQDGGPRAADPNASAGVLVLVDGERLIGRYAPRSGNFAMTAQDVDGDGIDEILLRQDRFQMGQSVASLQLVSVKNGLRELAQFDSASNDGCEGPPLTRKVTASVIRYRSVAGAMPKFQLQRYEAQCKDGQAPDELDAYRPVESPAP